MKDQCGIDSFEINGAEIDGCMRDHLVFLDCMKAKPICNLMVELIDDPIAPEKICVPNEDRTSIMPEELRGVVRPKGKETCS
jgi:hypothetical protein